MTINMNVLINGDLGGDSEISDSNKKSFIRILHLIPLRKLRKSPDT